MRRSSKRQAAAPHPGQLALFGGPPTAPQATFDPVGPAAPSPGRSTSPNAVRQRASAVPLVATIAAASKGLDECSKTSDDPSPGVDTLAVSVHASPCPALPTCRRAQSSTCESIEQPRFTLDTLWQAVRLLRTHQESSADQADHQDLRDEPQPATAGGQPATPKTRSGAGNGHPRRRPAAGRPTPRPDGTRAVPRLEGGYKS